MRSSFVYLLESAALHHLVSASPFLSLHARGATPPAGYSYQGCYTEGTGSRALTGSAYFDDQLTVEKCAAACVKYDRFGVEYGRECYCGNSFSSGSVAAPEADCSFACPGNAGQTCGAGNRLNVYGKIHGTTTTSQTFMPTPSSTAGPFKAQGCYTEATDGRALQGKTYYDDAMTIEKCASACAGFSYFGLEYYRECYCGNSLETGSAPTSASECKYPCSGDSSETCGGDYRLNLFSGDSVITTSSSTSAIPLPTNFALQGCYTEATNSRALTSAVYYDDAMSVEKCADVCQGFTFFGVEFARECYCGNTIEKGSVETAISECNFPCAGNKKEMCGAGNRLDLYRLGAGQSTISPSMTPSASTTSTLSTITSTTSTDLSTTSTDMSTTSTDMSTSISTTSSASSTSSSSTTSLSPSISSTTSTTSTTSSTSELPISSSSISSSDATTTTMISSTSSTSTTSTQCVPSPTQAILNPSFETDFAGTGIFTAPWVFSGNGLVESNTNNAYQSYDGTHFGVLYGRSTTTATISQSLNNLVPGQTYVLQYFYNVEQASPQAICKLTTTLGGEIVDTITSPTVRTGRYLHRSVPATPSASSAVLQFTLTCPRFLQLTAQSNYALDAITLTTAGDGCT